VASKAATAIGPLLAKAPAVLKSAPLIGTAVTITNLGANPFTNASKVVEKGILTVGEKIGAIKKKEIPKVKDAIPKVPLPRIPVAPSGMPTVKPSTNQGPIKPPTILQKIVDNPGKTALVVAGLAATAYAIEQGAEKLGVRGGAGFIGDKPAPKKKTSTKKKKSTKKRSSTRKKSPRTTPRKRKKASRRGYGTEAQYKRKGGKDVHYWKGKPYIIRSNGMWQWIKKSR